MRIHSRFLVVATALAVVIPDTAGAADKVRMGFVKGYAPAVISFAAQEAGIFKKNGIDAELMTFGGGGGVGEAIAAGALDIAGMPISALAPAIKQGLKARMVAANINNAAGFNLMVKKDSPIATIKDLDGKRIGITSAGSSTDVYSKYLAKQNGITLVNVSVGIAGLQALDRGQIDGMIGFPPNGDKARIEKSAKILMDLAVEIQPHVMDLLVATEDMIKKPDLLKRVLASFYGGVQKMQTDRAFALPFFKKFIGDQYSDEVALALYESIILKISKDGKINPATVDSARQMIVDSGVDAAKLAATPELFTTEFTPVKPTIID